MAELIPGETVLWASEGAQSNPQTTTVLADTGAIATVGTYLARVTVSSDTAIAMNIQWRNAANAANVEEQRIYLGANNTVQPVFEFRVDNASERLRVVPNANLTGNAAASIHYQRLA